jgi:hypothetical protein
VINSVPGVYRNAILDGLVQRFGKEEAWRNWRGRFPMEKSASRRYRLCRSLSRIG